MHVDSPPPETGVINGVALLVRQMAIANGGFDHSPVRCHEDIRNLRFIQSTGIVQSACGVEIFVLDCTAVGEWDEGR